jgi:FkbM family methyltransferase
MDSQSSHRHTDAIKSISNILREPAPRFGGESRETAAEIVSEPTPAPALQPRDESSETAAESNTPLAGEGAKPQRPSSSTNHVRAALWRFLVLCAEPILSRFRDYLLAPLALLLSRRADGIDHLIALLHAKFDGHAAETRTATECIQRQIVHLEFQSRNFAKQLAHLESQFGILANQLARSESRASSVHGRIELLVDHNSLVVGGELLARTPNGYVLVPADGPGFARFLAEAAVWEQATSRLLDLTLREGMTFVDVGADVGLHTLHGARRVGPTGAVIALEPTPNLFRLLQKSIRINDIENICSCINVALSSADGVATLEGSRYCGHNSLNQPVNEEAKAEFQVKTARLDNVLQGVRRVDVVKIDAGGAELAVLEGMNHVLANHREIVLIVEYGVRHLQRLGITPAEWFGRFFAHGLALFAFDEQTGAWRQIAEEHAGKLSSTMVAFVRPGTNQWTILKQHEL